ncbi:hypothetical protein EVAR_97488_1 [Eumeta japonica]|uniref:Uncharacterized protein n=1 Tax=Eumeta variegata TaxID=151549 RepID=A0A4C1Z3D3_EUMVA|nr:hypothetical protein EVAR_97488_1 [Eumeta japonica]
MPGPALSLSKHSRITLKRRARPRTKKNTSFSSPGSAITRLRRPRAGLLNVPSDLLPKTKHHRDSPEGPLFFPTFIFRPPSSHGSALRRGNREPQSSHRPRACREPTPLLKILMNPNSITISF